MEIRADESNAARASPARRTGTPGAQAADPVLDIRTAHALAVSGDLDAMRSQATRAPARSTPKLLLEAAIAQNEGRTDRSRTQYTRALKLAAPGEFAYVLDLLAPFVILDGDHDGFEDLRARHPVSADLAASFCAIDAISHAVRGDHDRSIAASDAALESISDAESELREGVILQRLAYAALCRRDFALAAEMATRSARTLEAAGAYRPAAAAYSIAYNVHHAETGDIDRAEVYASKMVAAARRSGDASLENSGLIAQYEIACECGDDEAARALRNRIDRLALAEQYAERFARGIGDVILAAIRNDIAAFYANAVLLRDGLANDRASIALASALRSLGAAAVGDVEEARRCSRNALGLATIRDALEPAYSARYRKLARALAASTCALIGDNARAQRAAARADDRHGFAVLVGVAYGAEIGDVPRRIRGYARMLTTVRAAVHRSLRHGTLSSAEYEVLILLAQGISAPQIARQTGRSVHTIRAHTRAIIAKFAVHGRAAAIAYAHRNGLLS